MKFRDATAVCGVVGPLVAATAILAATLVDPTFSWTTSALSDTGALPDGRSVTWSFVRESPQFLLFNGGLILTGIVGAPFAVSLWSRSENLAHRIGVAAFLAALVALALVGVFHLPRPPHGTFAIAHYLAATLALWTFGTGSALAGDVRRGLATIWLGIAHLLFWLLWAAVLASGPIPGLAVPETVGAAIFGGWTVATALDELDRSPATRRRGRTDDVS